MKYHKIKQFKKLLSQNNQKYIGHSNSISLFICAILIIALSLSQVSCTGATTKDSQETENETWQKISQYFEPPENLKDEYGEYRSPLLFENGDTVKSKADWERRRTEIKEKWMGLMGEWPAIITNQQMEIIDTVQRENFTQHRVSFYWTPNELTEGYLLIPNEEGEKPAVITVFYEPETSAGLNNKENRDFALQLAKKGFVTLSLGTTETTENKTYSIYYPNIENATVQPLSLLGYAAANAWEVLAKVSDVDAAKIGIVGHSYGGKWAMFASCLFDKFACAAWSDPGIVFDETKGSAVNYWEPWYLGYYPPPWESTWSKSGQLAKGIYPTLKQKGMDLHELHALMAPRPFLVSGGSSDPIERWIPLNHSIAVNKILGYENRVAMTNRLEHSPNESSNNVIVQFFETFLMNNNK